MKKAVIVAMVVLFAASLLLAQDVASIKKRLQGAAKSGDWAGFAGAVAELGAIDSRESAELILKSAFALEEGEGIPSDKRREVFDKAREALLKLNSKEVIAYLCDQITKQRVWEARALIAEILREKEGEGVVGALIRALKDKQPEVLREAVLSLVKHGKTESVDALIELLDRLEGEKGLVWVEVRKALTSLTGADYETAAKWREYWRLHKEQLKATPEPTETSKPPEQPTGEPRTSLLDEELKKAPKFFGKEIVSKRFCFVIDVSGTMHQEDRYSGGGEGGGQPVVARRVDMVKDQLKKMVAALDPKTKFNIIAFSSSVQIWQERKLASATAQNKQDAIDFVNRFNAFGTTHADEALKEAFANQEADTIVFLTDGAPTHSGRHDDTTRLISEIHSFVADANKSRKVVIDTFGFETIRTLPKGQECVDFLKKLASDTGGKFTVIK
jgi:hypothetical protein